MSKILSSNISNLLAKRDVQRKRIQEIDMFFDTPNTNIKLITMRSFLTIALTLISSVSLLGYFYIEHSVLAPEDIVDDVIDEYSLQSPWLDGMATISVIGTAVFAMIWSSVLIF